MTKCIETTVCIVGSGPGGALLGLKLAKAGINVVVLEKAMDFQREFRGESLSPDARQLLENEGLRGFIEGHGYLESKGMSVYENDAHMATLDFSGFEYKNKYVIEFPQPALLAGIVEEAKKYGNFTIMMGASYRKLLTDNGKIVGLTAVDSEKNDMVINSKLVVAADGRYSKIRKEVGFEADIKHVERDILWLKLTRPKLWPHEVTIKIKQNRHLIILPTYPDTVRVGINIPKGGYKEFRNKGISHLQDFVGDLEPLLAEYVKEEITDWNNVALLDMFTTRVPEWSIDGLALMGDAAHTITPMMGQGIKHALFDANKLSETVQNCLRDNPDDIIERKYLLDYENERQQQIDFILNVQQRQEKVFNLRKPMETLVRRTAYRIINSLEFVKTKIIKKIYFSGYQSL